MAAVAAAPWQRSQASGVACGELLRRGLPRGRHPLAQAVGRGSPGPSTALRRRSLNDEYDARQDGSARAASAGPGPGPRGAAGRRPERPHALLLAPPQGEQPERRPLGSQSDSQAGGTTVCHVARVANGLSAPRRNCNLPGDGPRTLDAGVAGYGNRDWDSSTCDGRLGRVVGEGLEFFAVERWLDVATFAHCRSQFFFATAIRKPVARVISHCRFERVPPKVALSWTRLESVEGDAPIQLGPAVVDNFYTRSLLGRQAFFDLRPGQVTASHARAAMRLLADFDAVLILERLDASFAQLYARLGWCKPSDPSDTRRSFGPGDTSIAFDDDQLALLENHNAPDNAVYDFATKLVTELEAPLVGLPTRACPSNGARRRRDRSDRNRVPGLRRPPTRPRRRGRPVGRSSPPDG